MKKISFFITIFILLVSTIIFAQKVHVVKKGDTLWDIAGFYYDNPFLWRNIYNANLDKIEDPHWIYPGQEFIIPDIPEDATYTETTTESSEISTEGIREAKDIIVEKTDSEKSVTYTKTSETHKNTKIRRIREDIKKVERSKSMKISNVAQYAVAKKLAFMSGYIAKENPAIGKISNLLPNSYSYTTHEKCYIDLFNEVNEDLIGKNLIVYEWKNKVKNSSGEYLGKYVRILGTVKVNKIEGNKAQVTITNLSSVFKKGAFVALYKEPYVPLNSAYLKESKDIRAYLIAEALPEFTLNEFSIVLIDIGKENNINSGDVFTIIRKNKLNKYYAAGALQVLVPYKGYSTATIISIKDNVDINPIEELRLAYRNKNSYILNQYRKINEIEEGFVATEESTVEETIIEAEEPVVEETTIETEEVTEEPVIEEATIETEEVTEEPVIEETIIEAEEPVIEETIIETEEPVVEETVIETGQDTTDTIAEEDIIIEEETVTDTDEGFIIEEETTNDDTIIVEGEDDIIIIEEE